MSHGDPVHISVHIENNSLGKRWTNPRWRVVGKIGMIIRRATQVVAGTTMPRSATPWEPDFTATLMGRGFVSGLPCQAPSEGGQPFASSPFAHPIPQNHRRASEDLFSASLCTSVQ